ncbi:MAG: tetratricopeptide repeat protein [Caulobacteraceae bacterium]
MMSFGLGGLGVSLLLSVLLCVHVVRTHRELYWLWIILLFQPIGGLVYLVAIVLPELFSGRTARKIGQSARETLDPARHYRDAKADYEVTPSVHNRMRLAAAAAELGRHDEAETLYGEALQGVHADDPALLLGRAKALLELGRPGEALELLQKLGQEGKEGQTPQAMLALARAYEGLGRTQEAAEAYDWAAPRVPGLEGVARHAAFLARSGRRPEAEEQLAEIDRRLQRSNPHFRKEGRAWRDLAAQAIAQA